MVLASLVHYSARLKCGIDMVGISNFVTFLENTADYRRDLRRLKYGIPFTLLSLTGAAPCGPQHFQERLPNLYTVSHTESSFSSPTRSMLSFTRSTREALCPCSVRVSIPSR